MQMSTLYGVSMYIFRKCPISHAMSTSACTGQSLVYSIFIDMTFCFVADMDVDNSDHEQYNTSCNQNTGKIGPKKYTTVKDAKKRSNKNTKTGSPLGNGG